MQIISREIVYPKPYYLYKLSLDKQFLDALVRDNGALTFSVDVDGDDTISASEVEIEAYNDFENSIVNIDLTIPSSSEKFFISIKDSSHRKVWKSEEIIVNT